MLVLGRKINEEIQISDDIVIQVVRLGSKSVSIGITAPRELRIHRRELLEEYGNGPRDKAGDQKTS